MTRPFLATKTAMSFPIRCLVAAVIAFPVAVLAQQTPGVLASHATHWRGVIADVTEFKRMDTALFVRLRLRNTGDEQVRLSLSYEKCSLLDSGARMTYEVVHDDAGTYVAAVNSNNSQWENTLDPGQSSTLWMRFPAPPMKTKSLSLRIDHVPQFDDLTIQDAF